MVIQETPEYRKAHYDNALIGRAREMTKLEASLSGAALRVAYVHGIAGIGKSHLLASFADLAGRRGVRVFRLDCRFAEPTPRGFVAELRSLLASRARSPAKLAEQLGGAGNKVVLLLDNYEQFRLLDTWFRQVFVPALPESVSIVMSSRQRPSAGWISDLGLRGRFQSIHVGPLEEAAAMSFLGRMGVKHEAARRAIQFTHGHPLALRLTAAALTERPGLQFEGLAIQGVLEELTRMYLSDVSDPDTRNLIFRVSVLRRITIPLLEAIAPEMSAEDAHDRLAALPFTEATRDGLMLHEAVRPPLARSLRARNPSGFQAARQAAWKCLTRELGSAAGSELWRYTADLLYLLENPVVREAFFPSGESWLQVEPARSSDEREIQEIVARYEGNETASDLRILWKCVPQAFSVVRGEDQECLGFYVAFDPAEVNAEALGSDPISASWLDHLRSKPLMEGQRVLFCRRWLSKNEGEAPSEVQAVCWLDLKRTYLEMRPELQRVYLILDNPAPFAAVATELGFDLLPELRVERDGTVHHGAVLDFGPGSVDGWLAGLLASEIGLAPLAPELDEDAREMIVHGRRVALTPLEFGVVRHLIQRPGKAVSRLELLNDVWGLSYEGGSNVVDTVVASLRRKLGDWAKVIETVTGTGYRYRSST